jgi:hypothetical protein
MVAPVTPESATAQASSRFVIVDAHGGEVVLRTHTLLDGTLGDVLTDATAAVTDVGVQVVCIDITDIERFTDAGVTALRTCRQIAHSRGVDLRFRADSATARQFLLTVLARE